MLPEDRRETLLSEMRPSLEMDDKEFDAFRRSILDPMIRRHEQMFPQMHQKAAAGPWQSGPLAQAHPGVTAPAKTYSAIDRYAPCPCGSGEKYKFCCGKKAR